MTRQSPDDGQAAEQGRGGRGPPAGPIAALVYPDGSTEELQPPGAAALLAASPELVDYARAHAESATSRVRFFWQHPGGQWLRVHLASALADALRRRGITDPAAGLTAEAGIAVFKIAFERWISGTGEAGLPQLIRESLDELRAVTAGT